MTFIRLKPRLSVLVAIFEIQIRQDVIQRRCDCFAFQNTYTNAAKLLEAARHLASSGDCNPEEVQKRVGFFETRVQEFIDRVNRRKALLKLAVNFYSRTQKVGEFCLCSLVFEH